MLESWPCTFHVGSDLRLSHLTDVPHPGIGIAPQAGNAAEASQGGQLIHLQAEVANIWSCITQACKFTEPFQRFPLRLVAEMWHQACLCFSHHLALLIADQYMI